MMTKMQRVRTAVLGGNTDHTPFGFWTHLPGIDLDPIRLAEETYEFYKTYDIDISTAIQC